MHTPPAVQCQELRTNKSTGKTVATLRKANLLRLPKFLASLSPSARGKIEVDDPRSDDDDDDSVMWEPVQELTFGNDAGDETKELMSGFADFWFQDKQYPVTSMSTNTLSCPGDDCGICFHSGRATSPTCSPTQDVELDASMPLSPVIYGCAPSPTSPYYMQPQLIPSSVTDDSHDCDAHAHWPRPLRAIPAVHALPMMPLAVPSLEHHVNDDDAASKPEDDLSQWEREMGLMMETI